MPASVHTFHTAGNPVPTIHHGKRVQDSNSCPHDSCSSTGIYLPR